MESEAVKRVAAFNAHDLAADDDRSRNAFPASNRGTGS